MPSIDWDSVAPTPESEVYRSRDGFLIKTDVGAAMECARLAAAAASDGDDETAQAFGFRKLEKAAA